MSQFFDLHFLFTFKKILQVIFSPENMNYAFGS